LVLNISLLKTRNRFGRLFENPTVHCCFYADCLADRAKQELRTSFAFLIFFSLQFFLTKIVSNYPKIEQKLQCLVRMYLAIDLYPALCRPRNSKINQYLEKALVAAVSSRPPKTLSCLMLNFFLMRRILY